MYKESLSIYNKFLLPNPSHGQSFSSPVQSSLSSGVGSSSGANTLGSLLTDLPAYDSNQTKLRRPSYSKKPDAPSSPASPSSPLQLTISSSFPAAGTGAGGSNVSGHPNEEEEEEDDDDKGKPKLKVQVEGLIRAGIENMLSTIITGRSSTATDQASVEPRKVNSRNISVDIFQTAQKVAQDWLEKNIFPDFVQIILGDSNNIKSVSTSTGTTVVTVTL